MQMCAWRKPLDVGQSINSRNLEEWLISLTFVSAGSRVCWRALPSSIVFFYRMWLFSIFFFFYWLKDSLALRMCHQDCIWAIGGCLPGEFELCGSEGAHCWASFPFQPQQSISASAVILQARCKGQGPGQWLLCKILIASGISQRWFRGHFWALEGCSSTPDEFCFLSLMSMFSFTKTTDDK